MSELGLSRVMRQRDYDSLLAQILHVNNFVSGIFGSWHPVHHTHRRWEYAMALLTYDRWKLQEQGPFSIADFGAGTGYLSPLLYQLGHDMTIHEFWSMDPTVTEEKILATRQMEVVKQTGSSGNYQILDGVLSRLEKKYYGQYDIAFCISTIEHITDYREAVRDLCKSIKKTGGLVFLTMDFGDGVRASSQYMGAHCRPSGMPDSKYAFELLQTGQKEGFEVFGGEPDWQWDANCQLVNDYGFASLALYKKGERR